MGLSIGTDDDKVRRILAPRAPSIKTRVETLTALHEAGISTWASISPILPMDPERLYEMVDPYVDSVLTDALNYPKQIGRVFRQQGWDYVLESDYAEHTEKRLRRLLGSKLS